MTETLRVEVVAAWPERVFRELLELAPGATVADALAASEVLRHHPELGPAPAVGIHSRRARPDQLLRDGDRVEVYRPLTLDPKEARRRRAAAAASRQG